MLERFAWRGGPISDVRAWAAARGERMVRYRAERSVPNPFTGQIDVEVREGAMPESFWGNLTMTNGWTYVERGGE